MSSTWAPSGVGRYNLTTGAPVSAQTELTAVSTPSASEASAAGLCSPENPLLWFAVLAGLTFGAMAFSTSVRVGGTTASVGVGKT